MLNNAVISQHVALTNTVESPEAILARWCFYCKQWRVWRW